MAPHPRLVAGKIKLFDFHFGRNIQHVHQQSPHYNNSRPSDVSFFRLSFFRRDPLSVKKLDLLSAEPSQNLSKLIDPWEILKVIFMLMFVIYGWGIFCEIALRWMLLDPTDD